MTVSHAAATTTRWVGIAMLVIGMLTQYFYGALAQMVMEGFYDRLVEFTIIDLLVRTIGYVGVPLGAAFVGASLVLTALSPDRPEAEGIASE